MKIVYMGTPEFAVPALEALVQAGHEVACAVTQPDKAVGRGRKIRFSPVKEKALELGIPVLQPGKIKGNEEFLAELRRIAPELIVVAAYGRILPPEVLELPGKGCLNIHGSLLPRFRGAAPIQWAIASGDPVTGVTIMKMEEGLDTGDMLAKTSVEIGEKTAGQLHDELARAGARLLAETLEKLEELEPEKQEDALSCYAPMITKADGRADFSLGAESLERRIRAFDPWPGVFTELEGRQMKLWHASVPGITTDVKDGTVVAAGPEGIDIASAGQILRVDEIQMPGKKRVPVREYLKGNAVEIGSVLR